MRGTQHTHFQWFLIQYLPFIVVWVLDIRKENMKLIVHYLSSCNEQHESPRPVFALPSVYVARLVVVVVAVWHTCVANPPPPLYHTVHQHRHILYFLGAPHFPLLQQQYCHSCKHRESWNVHFYTFTARAFSDNNTALMYLLVSWWNRSLFQIHFIFYFLENGNKQTYKYFLSGLLV